MSRFILAFILMFSIHAQAELLTKKQEEVKRTAHDVGSKNCIDGFCFTKILQAIAWQESSFGRHVIGDSKGISYYYKHQGKVINVRKEDTFKINGVAFTYYQPEKNKYLKRVYARSGFKPIEQSSLGPFQIKVTTAQEVISKMELRKFYPLLSDEAELVGKLLTDARFGAVIAVNFLKMHYMLAKKNGVIKPQLRAISRYNGGNNNHEYVNLIMMKVKQL